MFAEDLGQLEGHLFTQIVDDLIANPQRSSADDLGQLFEWLNRPGDRPAGGSVCDDALRQRRTVRAPCARAPRSEELEPLRLACDYDWRRVEPHIFGSLLEGALGPEAQGKLGAHYTHEVDIQKVIKPTIVDPWRERIETASTLAQVRQLQNELLNFVVLDPACGSGNFLYIAYRELRRLEQRLHEKERELRLAEGRRAASQSALTAFFPLTNIKGIEINAFAVSLARVTLWMAHKLAVDELDLDESTLPLEDLSGIRAADALRAAMAACERDRRQPAVPRRPPSPRPCSATTTSSGSSASSAAASRTTACTGSARRTTTCSRGSAPASSAPTRSRRTARDRRA